MAGRGAVLAAAAVAASLLVPGATAHRAAAIHLRLTVTAPDLIDAHDGFSYKVTMKNVGTDSLYNASFVDHLPAQVTLKNVGADPRLTCTVKGQDVTCRPASEQFLFLKSGDSETVTISVQDNAEGPATLTNTVQGNAPRVQENPTVTSTTQVAAADVTVTKTGPTSPVHIDDALTYTLTVTNKGKDRASNVQLVDTIPPLVSNVAAQGCQIGSTVLCQLGTVNAGETRTVQVTETAASDGAATDTATVSTSSTDTDHTNDSAQVTTTILKKPVDLAIAMTVTPAKANVGDHLTYRIVVTNKGPGTEPSTVTDKLPSSMQFLSVSSPCTHAGATVTCPIGVLAVGASAAPIVISAKAVGAGSVVNEADVTGALSDPVSTNNDTRVTAVVKKPKPRTTTTTHTTTTPPTTTHATTTAPTTTGTTTTTPTSTTPKHKHKQKPPREQPRPKVSLSPPVGPLGTVVHVTGSGFPPNARVALRWSKGIGGATPTTGKRGRFETTMLIFQTDVLGPRRLFASPGPGSPSYDVVDARFLVSLRALQPADFR